jgi:steroid delta-isomerase-like uncharacterized protein
MKGLDIAKSYYQHFNTQNWEGMLALVAEDLRHEPNQGQARLGKDLFRAFLAKMNQAYAEQLDNMVFLSNEDQTRIAVEFTVQGRYLQAEEGLPPAHGQSYTLPAAAFLEIQNGLIRRITTYYNLPLWIELVS